MKFERSSATLVFKDVPAEICATCGETCHSEDVTRDLLRQAEHAVFAGAQVLVCKYTT
jgi:histidinol dehydrogenase